MAQRKRMDENRNAIREAKTFREKRKAFWYLYKVHTIVITVLIVFLGAAVFELATTPRMPMADFYVVCMTKKDLTIPQRLTIEEEIKRCFPQKDQKNPSIEFVYYVYPDSVLEESGGDDGYAQTGAAVTTSAALFNKIKKTNALYLYDTDYIPKSGSEEKSVNLSEEFPDAPGVEGCSFFLKQSKVLDNMTISAYGNFPDDIQLRMRNLDEMQWWGMGSKTKEKYEWQQEAVENLIQGTPVRTREQVNEADAEYRQALQEYSE